MQNIENKCKGIITTTRLMINPTLGAFPLSKIPLAATPINIEITINI